MDREDDSGLNQERTQRTFLEKRKSSIRYVCLVYIGSTLDSIYFKLLVLVKLRFLVIPNSYTVRSGRTKHRQTFYQHV